MVEKSIVNRVSALAMMLVKIPLNKCIVLLLNFFKLTHFFLQVVSVFFSNAILFRAKAHLLFGGFFRSKERC